MIKISVFPVSSSHSRARFIMRACASSGLICLIFFAVAKEPLFKQNSELNRSVQLKAITMSKQFEERNLALNFLGNIRKLDPAEKMAFQNSGIGHLLAISGGQVSILVAPIVFITTQFFFVFGRFFYSSFSLRAICGSLKNWLGITLSLIIASAFGSGGLLMRVGFLTYIRSVPLVGKFSWFLHNWLGIASWRMWERFLLLGGVSFILGNPLINPSFMLSALGASMAHGVMLVVGQGKTLRQNMVRGSQATLGASFTVGLILMPFATGSIWESLCANLLALPITNLLITPLSVLCLISPWQGLTHFAMHYLDKALHALSWTAELFASGSRSPWANLFSPWAQFYLLTVLIISWLIQDWWEERVRKQLEEFILI